jgi:hypothetical protein
MEIKWRKAYDRTGDPATVGLKTTESSILQSARVCHEWRTLRIDDRCTTEAYLGVLNEEAGIYMILYEVDGVPDGWTWWERET